jgi:hypothetical protein
MAFFPPVGGISPLSAYIHVSQNVGIPYTIILKECSQNVGIREVGVDFLFKSTSMFQLIFAVKASLYLNSIHELLLHWLLISHPLKMMFQQHMSTDAILLYMW